MYGVELGGRLQVFLSYILLLPFIFPLLRFLLAYIIPNGLE
jgi:hypothetical protein